MRASPLATRRHLHPHTPPRLDGGSIQVGDLVARFRETIDSATAMPRKQARLTRLLHTRDADGHPVLSRAASHRDTVDTLMKAIFMSTLPFDAKRALMVQSLHLIGRTPCDADALIDTIVAALGHLRGAESSSLYDGLNAVLLFTMPPDIHSSRTAFELLLTRRDIGACRTALIELMQSVRIDSLTCCLRPKAGRALVHRLLAHEDTAPLFLDLVLLLPRMLPLCWATTLEKLLFARTRHDRTPLWTADLGAQGVAGIVMSVLYFILERDDLCTEGKCRLLIGFASPPVCARRVGWALIQRTYSTAFASPVLDDIADARLVEVAVLRQFKRWNEALDPLWVQQSVADAVAQHPLPPAARASLLQRLRNSRGTANGSDPRVTAAGHPADNSSTA
ncbi:hypothetical protein ASE08_00490 [Rhizobacter sp. Root16D2]|nr:hypothetical protein ASC88_06025 [Rhizobacter sp. Root29]KQW10642.1 hypothetical protein ASC98_22610 [Rhizobacter sp. Root1238]KRB24718.1 hypothetical protein ASE08_00490 [Rhizobacter sp. Root16D2]